MEGHVPLTLIYSLEKISSFVSLTYSDLCICSVVYHLAWLQLQWRRKGSKLMGSNHRNLTTLRLFFNLSIKMVSFMNWNMLFTFLIAQTGSFIPSFCCQTQKIDWFENLSLKIDGFGQTHRNHANDATVTINTWNKVWRRAS